MVALRDILKRSKEPEIQIDRKTGISFTKEEQQWVHDNAVSMWTSDSSPIAKQKIVDLDARLLHGAASYALAAKKYDLCGRLLSLSEDRITNPVDLHFCYLSWIKLLYPQREDPEKLRLCKDYCKKDINLWQAVRNDPFFNNHETNVPSFQKLKAIYEKEGKFDEALKVCEMAKSDDRLSDHDMWVKRYSRVEKKIQTEEKN